jgi:hypothetical protein
LFDFDNGGSDLVNNIKFSAESIDKLQVMIFHGQTSNENYPYRNTKDFLGILTNKVNICTPPLQFMMHQEQKQLEKNTDHLKNLLDNNQITEEQLQAAY